MLKYRVMTALVLLPLVIWAILQLGQQAFSLVLLVIMVLAAWEWSSLSAVRHQVARISFTITVAALLYLSQRYLAQAQLGQLLIVTSLWWILCVPLLLRFPFGNSHWLSKQAIKLLLGVIIIFATFTSLVLLRNSPQYGPGYLLYLLIIIWLADSAAYFAGRAFGRRKLLPAVSPGKSWEGVYGAFAATLLAAIVATNYFAITGSKAFAFIVLTLITVIFSVVGDLSESMFKRMVNLKDSGNILPGHGGILDRIDSLTAAAPIFMSGLWIMEHYL